MRQDKEKYKGFMIMPFLSDEEQKEIGHEGKNNIKGELAMKKLSNDFYRKIIKKVCADKEINIDINRADEINKQKIDNAIIEGIKNSHVFIVDLTLMSPNVMYELGMTHSIDIERTLIITQDKISHKKWLYTQI